MITTTYTDQYTPARAGFFVLDELGSVMHGAEIEQLRSNHNRLLMLALREQQPIARALYRDQSRRARAAIMAVAFTDEIMVRSPA